jgi:uncharacterized membrane protein HdeD (DUF308 family)
MMIGFKETKWNNKVNLIVLLIIGLLLLIFPKESLNIACYLIASILMLGGFTYIIRIIKKKSIETNGDLISVVASIAAIAISVTIFIDPTWIIRVINVIIGLLLIINSILNIINLLKFSKDRTSIWWIFLSFTILIMIVGVLIIINPEFLMKVVVRLEGASLVIDTILTMILSHKLKKLLEIDKPKVVREIKVIEEN